MATTRTTPADKTVYVATVMALRPSPRAHMNYAVLIPVYEVASSASGKMAYEVGGDLFLLPFSQMMEVIVETTPRMQKDATRLVVQNPSIFVPPQQGRCQGRASPGPAALGSPFFAGPGSPGPPGPRCSKPSRVRASPRAMKDLTGPTVQILILRHV